jgi:hypothetical protein
MKLKYFLPVLGAVALLAAGCVKTVSGGHAAALPSGKDKVEGRYERSVDEVFSAAKDVISKNGVLDMESIVHSETNQVKTAKGKVNERNVYVRVEPATPTITAIVVQTRNKNGTADIYLAHELEKQIALKLIR